ncbi:MAG TPA: Maf family protein [Myxococcaceae bacterium]|nr:Maf family protein [Myxococcaceae bacterium]
MGQVTLVLASASPRRRALLQGLGVAFDAVAPGLDESVRPGEPPRDYVLRVAVEKAAAGARLRPGALVLAADTSVVLGDRILGKPAGEAEAREMVRALSGRRHSVLTGVALDGAARASAVVETAVWFRPLSEAEIAWYASTGEPLDKAGAYAIQGAGGVLVQRIEGSASNVVGLPLAETAELLRQAGFPLPWSAR